MKNQLAQTDLLFLDRPLPATPRPASRVSALHLVGFDRTDYADSILRVFLVLSLLGSLAMCGLGWNTPTAPAAKAVVVQHTGAAPSSLVCSTPRAVRDVL